MRTVTFMKTIFILLIVCLTGCTTMEHYQLRGTSPNAPAGATFTPFNQRAYEQATSLKVDALSLMGKATQPYAYFKSEINVLKIHIEKAYEFTKGRPNTEINTKHWRIIKDPMQNSLGGFLKRWEEKSTLSKAYISEAKKIVADGFDTIIELESGKRNHAN